MKRIVAFCIALLLCLGMFSMPAFSEEIQTAVGNKVVAGEPTSKDGALTPKSCVKIRFGKMPSKLELGQGPYPIAWKVWYRYSFGDIYASTSNYNVIGIQNGCLVAKSLGSAKITLTCDGKTATRSFTVVPPKPKGVNLISAVSIQRGSTRKLSPSVYPSLAPQAVSFSSSNKKVATVDSNGLITAVNAGTANITVKAKKNSRAKATCLVTVFNSAADVTRRGLVMGECSGRHGSYDSEKEKKGERLATVANVNGMFKLLRKYGVSARKLVNPSTSASALEAIRSTFAGADSNDVSYLYINAHGGVSYNIFYMAIGSDGYTENDIFLSAPQLKAELDKVPGTKVIFLESCQSGSVIGKGVKGGLLAADAFRTTDAFIKAFKGSAAPKAGEFATNGYYVLCSVSGAEYSWYTWNNRLLGYRNFTGALFTHGLTKGAGWDMMRKKNISAPADKNKDKALSHAELYTYARNTVEAAKAEYRRYGIDYIHQVVQCYPNNSPYVLFAK